MPKSSSERQTPSSRSSMQHRQGLLRIAHHAALGDLQDQPGRPACRCAPGSAATRSGSCRVADVAGRQVDRDADRVAVRASQSRHCASAASSTSGVSASISPVDSASGMNRSGPSTPSVGWFQRTSASTPVTSAGAQVDLGLVVHDQLLGVGGQRHPQVGQQRQPLDPAAVHLRAVHRDPAVVRPWPHTSRCRPAAAGRSALSSRSRDRDPDAALRGQHRLVERTGSASAVGRPRSASAAAASTPPTSSGSSTANSSPPSRATVASAGTALAQPVGDHLQQPVADVVAEDVVDLLEPVEVQQQHRGCPSIGSQRRAGSARSGARG